MKFPTGLRISLLPLLASLSGSIWGQTPAAPQAEQKPGSIEGVVLLETTQEPVRRVEVTAFLRRVSPPNQSGATSQSGFGGGMPNEPLRAVTDAEGKFRFADVEPGTYFLNVRRQGFVTPRRSSFASSGPAQVSPGQTLKGLKFSLLPQAIIAGRVIDEEGDPVQGGMVMALVSRYTNGRQMWMPEGQGAQTNDKGEFRIIGLAAGKYLLNVSPTNPLPPEPAKAGQSAYGYVTTYYPGSTSPTQATPVTVTAGQELAGSDIILKKAAVFSIRGKVLDLEGQPVRDFYPNLMPREMPFQRGAIASQVSRNQDGTFHLGGVPSGTYTLNVNIMQRMAVGAQPQPGNRPQMMSVPVDVGSHDVNDLIIRMEPPFQVTGSVKVETDGDKPSLANLTVSLVSTTGMMYGGLQARTKDDGTFSLDVPSRGRYRLNAFGVNARNAYLAAVRIGSEDYLGKELDLTGGAPGPIQLIYRTDGGQVSGTAERPEGQGGQAMAFLLAKDPALRMLPGNYAASPISQTGTFNFSSIRPGEYWVVALDSNQGIAFDSPEIMTQLEPKAATIKVQANGTANVQVKVQPAPEQ